MKQKKQREERKQISEPHRLKRFDGFRKERGEDMPSRKRYEKYEKQGLCVVCGKNPPRTERKTCEQCAQAEKIRRQLRNPPKPKKEKKRKPRTAQGGIPYTICQHCDNMVCSWRSAFVPVEGWTAIPLEEQDVMVGIEEVQVIDGKVRGIKKRIRIMTYNVRRCPEFRRKNGYANDNEFRNALESVCGTVQTGMAWITCKRGNGRKKRNERLY